MMKNDATGAIKDDQRSQSKNRGLIAAKRAIDDAFRRKVQAFAALVTVVSLLIWAEVLSVPKKLVQLHQIITNQKKPRKGSVLLLLGWLMPLPRYLYWLGYLVPFLILSDPDDEDAEIREYLAKRKIHKKELRLFKIPAARSQYLKHFGQFYAYDLIPFSARFCLIDTQLTVKETAEIFKELGIEEAPFWDSSTRRIVGVCKAKCFVNALARCTGSFVAYDARKLDRLTWHKIFHRDTSYPQPSTLLPSDTWTTTVNAIKSNPHRRAIVYEESNTQRNNALMLLGVHRIFQYIYYKLETYKLLNLLDMTIADLDVGTFNDLICVGLETSFHELIATLVESGVSTLPVTNKTGRFTYLLDTAMLFDVVRSCPTRVRLTVADVLGNQACNSEEQLSRVVYPTDSLKSVLTRLNEANGKNLVVLDEDQTVKGIITISDMLLFLGLSVGAFRRYR